MSEPTAPVRSRPGAALRALALAASLTLAPGCAVDVHDPGATTLSGVRMSARDGVELVGDVMLPSAAGRVPTILEITPYGRGPEALNFRSEAGYWNRHGYAFAIFDSRGQGESGGEFELFRTSGRDGHDLVEWIATRNWSDGRVAMRGSSYTGTNQLYVAATRPPHLRCITPSAAAAGPRRDLPYRNGAFRFDWALSWPTSLASAATPLPPDVDWPALLRHRPLLTADEVVFGAPQSLYRSFLEHPPGDPYWEPIDLGPTDYAEITVPSLAFTGWFDGTLTGTVAHHRGLSAHSSAAGGHFLVIGPWQHLTAPDGGHDYRTYEPVTRVGDLELKPHAFLNGLELTRAFFDWCVKGEGGFDPPATRVYLTGSHRWLDSPAYPPPDMVQRPLYLRSGGGANGVGGDGSLAWEPSAGGAADRYTHDPLDPVAASPGDGLAADGIERLDVLVYASDPLAEPVTVAGPARLVLWAASDAPDTDFVSRLEDVAPDGTVRELGHGIVRARYRNGFAAESPLEPDVPARFEVDYGETGHTFLPGHRIRIRVGSSSYPAVFPNPGTGNPIATDRSPPRRAVQRVFHDVDRPSRVLLPVVPDPAPGGAPGIAHLPEDVGEDLR